MDFVVTEWRYENAITDGNSNEEGPKLEDFLGCYQNQNQNSTTNTISKINVNVTPSFCTNNNTEIETRENLTNQSLIHSFHHGYNDNNNNNNHHGLIHGNSMYKSWMSQNHFSCDGKNSSDGNGFQSLNLTMSPSVQNGVSVGVGVGVGGGAISTVQVNEDPRKRSLSKSNAPREPVPRKSIDTFGQRTSQYRGVTRYIN
jgi:AP2-like factor (ANT lineage)